MSARGVAAGAVLRAGSPRRDHCRRGIERAPAERGGIRRCLCASLDELLGHDLVLAWTTSMSWAAERRQRASSRAFCRHAPDTLHLVVSSRDELPFPIARRRGRGEVPELDASDPALTQDEAAEPTAITLAKASRSSDGRSMRRRGRAGRGPDGGRGTEPGSRRGISFRARGPTPAGRPVVSYVAEEVLEREPGDVVDLSRRAAWLECVNPAPRVAVGLWNVCRSSPHS